MSSLTRIVRRKKLAGYLIPPIGSDCEGTDSGWSRGAVAERTHEMLSEFMTFTKAVNRLESFIEARDNTDNCIARWGFVEDPYRVQMLSVLHACHDAMAEMLGVALRYTDLGTIEWEALNEHVCARMAQNAKPAKIKGGEA